MVTCLQVMLQFKMQLPNLTQPSRVEKNQLPVWTAKKLTEGYFPAAVYMLLFESALTYFIKSGKRVILPLLGRPPPVVEHGSIFPRGVGERHPLPRPDFLGAQFCFDCSITLSCIAWQQWRCVPVVEKRAGDEKQGTVQDKLKDISGSELFLQILKQLLFRVEIKKELDTKAKSTGLSALDCFACI